MPKLKKVINKKELKQVATGKLENEPTQYSNLYQMLGDTGLNKYGTLDVTEYEAKLNKMDTSELHRHATQNLIKPIHNRQLIIRSLVGKFQVYANQFIVVNGQKVNETPDDELQRILNKGK